MWRSNDFYLTLNITPEDAKFQIKCKKSPIGVFLIYVFTTKVSPLYQYIANSPCYLNFESLILDLRFFSGPLLCYKQLLAILLAKKIELVSHSWRE